MQTPLEKFRDRLGLSLADLATKLGVSETQARKWERRWEEIPPATLRDLAVAYAVNARSILDEQSAPESWGTNPFALSDVEEPYGTLLITFDDGKELEFPISLQARASVFSQLGRRQFSNCENKVGVEPWLYFWGLDDRIAFARMGSIREIAILSDDERGTPYFAHPEVYRWIGGEEVDGEGEKDRAGPILLEAIERHSEVLGGREAAEQQASNALLMYRDGRELSALCNSPETASAFFTLDLCSDEIPISTFLQIEDTEDYHEAYFVNIDALRFISIPAEAYHRATRVEA